MEANTNTILSGMAMVIAVGGALLAIINHKKLVSKCCGRKVDVSLDIQDTRIDSPKPIIEVPPRTV
jgi:hypothetical protein